MGRLLRKKAPDAKKRKSRETGGVNSEESRKNVQTPFRPTAVFGAVTKNLTAKPPAAPLKPALPRKKTEPGKIRLFVDKSVQFLREVKVELGKVAWPSRKQTIGSTIVVLILVLMVSVFLGAADIGLGGVIRFVLK
jgi:preprotein translocase subunit SecE